MAEQLFFDFDFTPVKSVVEKRKRKNTKKLLKRSVIKWLMESQTPTSLAADVVTRISQIKAEIAAFWSDPVRNRSGEGPWRIFKPNKTLIVQCYAKREDCWPDCVKSEGLVSVLKHLNEKRHEMEEQIKLEEPNLKVSETLFDEFADWDFSRSSNKAYQSLCAKIKAAHNAVYQKTRFERIRQGMLADYLYLAVPEGTIYPEELAEGWALLWVDEDLNITVKAEADCHSCNQDNRIHLIQNIAAANMSHALQSYGVYNSRKRGVHFVKPTRGHVKPIDLTLT